MFDNVISFVNSEPNKEIKAVLIYMQYIADPKMFPYGTIKGLRRKVKTFINQKFPAVRKSIKEFQSESIFCKSTMDEMGFARKEKLW